MPSTRDVEKQRVLGEEAVVERQENEQRADAEPERRAASRSGRRDARRPAGGRRSCCRSSPARSRASDQDGAEQQPVDVEVEPPFEHGQSFPPDGAAPPRASGRRNRAASPRGSAAAAAACRPAWRRRCRGCAGRPRRRWARACRARGRPRRRSAGCRAARRTRTSRCRAGPRLPRAAARPWFEMTWAVPVLPETSWPAMRARPPVPAPLTTIHMPVADRLRASPAVTSIFDCGGGAATGFHPVPSSTALSRCGVTRVPPLASVAM